MLVYYISMCTQASEASVLELEDFHFWLTDYTLTLVTILFSIMFISFEQETIFVWVLDTLYISLHISIINLHGCN